MGVASGLSGAQAFDPPRLNDVQQRALDGLVADGIGVISFPELFGEEMWEEVLREVEPFVAESGRFLESRGAKPLKKDELILRRWHSRREGRERHTFSLGDPWLRATASPQVLDIVNTYRGELTRLHYADHWFTVPYAEIEERMASQRWHRDPEEEHVVKVFTYFNDVDEGAGPFEYVRSSASGGRYGDFWPWGGRENRHPPTEELDAATAPDDRLTLVGPAGTMLFCDTGGFHRGGFAREKPRVMGTSTYVSGHRGKTGRFKVDYQGREPELPEQVRAALPPE